MVWSFIVLTIQGFLYYLFISGVDFPNFQTQETATTRAIFNWSLAFFAITSLIVLIELSREKDIVARLGGDEFAVLMNHVEKTIPIDSLAETIHN